MISLRLAIMVTSKRTHYGNKPNPVLKSGLRVVVTRKNEIGRLIFVEDDGYSDNVDVPGKKFEENIIISVSSGKSVHPRSISKTDTKNDIKIVEHMPYDVITYCHSTGRS